MAANFNSFIHPAVIMLTVPLSVFGGIIFILLFNSSINIFSQIALVILIGISTKNSILIVDWANQLRRTGKNIQSAALEACKRRFRAIIMLTVPLSVFGGIVFILLFNSSINIFSQIALVILIGISTKNSILIVDWANQLRRSGKNIRSAALEACKRRFRAIIMTSLSTMIAMVPLLIGNIGPGAGEGSRLAVGATIF